MIKFRIDDKHFMIASEWADLNKHQIWHVIPYAYSERENMKVRLELLTLLVPTLKYRLMQKLNDQQRLDVMALTEWVYTKTPEINGITHFTFKEVDYYLPKPELDDTVAIEFAIADLAFKDFVSSSEPAYLNKLVAHICRPLKTQAEQEDPHWDGSPRLRYNGAIADRKAEEFSSLPFSTKIIVLNHFAQMQRLVFDSYSIFDQSPTGGGEGAGFDIGWLQALFELAEQAVFGDFDKTCYTNINTVCLYMHAKGMRPNDK